ncbi:MAG: TetR/AcrR family transcriptional regulator [Nakamurella sp.]
MDKSADDSPHSGGSRSYRSPARAAHAAATRRKITAAAGELFASHGFTGTTVAAIAGRAGVTAQTVYATFGSKGAIVGALLAQFEASADADAWAAAIVAEDDPSRKLAAFAHWTTALFASSKAVITGVQGAAGDPAMVELRRQGDRHRRAALTSLVGELAGTAALNPDVSERHCIDRAWLLTGVETYLGATDGCGWSDAEYSRWLCHLLQTQLLASPPPARQA